MVLALTLTGMRIYQVTRGQRSPCRPGPCRAAALGPALGTRPLLSCRRCPVPCSCCTTSPGPTLGSWRSWCVSGGVAARRVPPTKSPGVPRRACPQAVYWAPRPPPDPVPGCLGPGALPRARTRPCTGGAGTSPPSGSHAENVRGNGGAQTCIVWPPPSRRPCPCGPGPRASPWARPGPRSGRAGSMRPTGPGGQVLWTVNLRPGVQSHSCAPCPDGRGDASRVLVTELGVVCAFRRPQRNRLHVEIRFADGNGGRCPGRGRRRRLKRMLPSPGLPDCVSSPPRSGEEV